MVKSTPGEGSCCLPAAEGLTYLRIGSRQVTVGLFGLETIFEQLYLMGRTPDATTDEEFLGMVRKRNYISRNPGTESNYATAIRNAYLAYYTRQVEESEIAHAHD